MNGRVDIDRIFNGDLHVVAASAKDRSKKGRPVAIELP
jgi:hypothetical protein